MRVMLWTLLLLLGFVSEASAQMVISVDTSISRNTDKSLAAAMALSALVPGLGQNYLGERQRVKPYIWAGLRLRSLGLQAKRIYAVRNRTQRNMRVWSIRLRILYFWP